MTTRGFSATTVVRPFKIDVAAAKLDVIWKRVRAFRRDAWSKPADAEDWRYGPPFTFIRGLCEHWVDR